jgi:hypothetical protein
MLLADATDFIRPPLHEEIVRKSGSATARLVDSMPIVDEQERRPMRRCRRNLGAMDFRSRVWFDQSRALAHRIEHGTNDLQRHKELT